MFIDIRIRCLGMGRAILAGENQPVVHRLSKMYVVRGDRWVRARMSATQSCRFTTEPFGTADWCT